MRLMPLGIQVVYIHATETPPKNTQECVVDRMPCDTTQCRTLETTFCVGVLDYQ
jgi:hypothetical protein